METNEIALLKKLGHNVKKLRELRGFSREQIAEHLQISPTWFRKMENGQARISFKILDEVAAILNVGMVDIIQFDDQQVFTNHHHQQGPFHGTYIDQSSSNLEEKVVEMYERIILQKDEQIHLLKTQIEQLSTILGTYTQNKRLD